MLDASGTSTYTYDHADRLNVVTNGYGQSVSYSYSGINQRLTLQDPSLATFSYTYDAARRLSTVVNPQNSRTTFTYDLADRRMLAHNGNGTSTSYVYDAADRLLWLNHFGPGSAGIAGFTYTYDNVGNPQSVLELDGSTVDWTNDGANQLILEDRTGTDAAHRKNYYDGRGNRFEQDLNSGLTKVNGFTYDNADQLKVLTSYNLPAIATLTSYTYDPAGNLLGVLNPPGTQPTTFVWDDEGRSKLVQLPTGVSVTSTFNGDNLRMQRVDNTGTVRYVWDSQAYLAETDGSNVMQAEYTQEPAQYGGLLSQYRLTGGVWTPSYYHFDRIGSTRALTSSSGSITDTYFYEAFGTSLGGTGSTVNPFQFIGQLGYYRDAASGLYYVRDRVYDPVTGRWVSRDRIGFASGDSNPFRYVASRPTFSNDPTGLIATYIPGRVTLAQVFLTSYSDQDRVGASLDAQWAVNNSSFPPCSCSEIAIVQISELRVSTQGWGAEWLNHDYQFDNEYGGIEYKHASNALRGVTIGDPSKIASLSMQDSPSIKKHPGVAIGEYWRWTNNFQTFVICTARRGPKDTEGIGNTSPDVRGADSPNYTVYAAIKWTAELRWYPSRGLLNTPNQRWSPITVRVPRAAFAILNELMHDRFGL